MKVVVINGVPRSGKDTFCELCAEIKGHYVYNVSTVDFVKEVARTCGWNGTKDAKSREFLSNLKDLLTEFNDVPYKKVEKFCHQVESTTREFLWDNSKVIVFIHCREPKEIAKFVERMGASTLLIRREDVEGAQQSNHADSEVFNYDYDYELTNNGTIEEFKETARTFLKEMEVL